MTYFWKISLWKALTCIDSWQFLPIDCKCSVERLYCEDIGIRRSERWFTDKTKYPGLLTGKAAARVIQCGNGWLVYLSGRYFSPNEREPGLVLLFPGDTWPPARSIAALFSCQVLGVKSKPSSVILIVIYTICPWNITRWCSSNCTIEKEWWQHSVNY